MNFVGGSGHLYAAAVKCFLNIPESVGDLEDGQAIALGALILSAASIEGFLNELGDMIARDPEGAPWRPIEINKYGEAWKIAEDCRASVRYKYELALEIFDKSPLDKSKDPWQSFDTLIKIRDGLVHLKTGRGEYAPDYKSVIDNAKLARDLQSRKLLADPGTNINVFWVYLIQTRAAANWACEIASSTVRSLVELIPGKLNIDKQASWKSMNLRLAYKAFVPVADAYVDKEK